MRFIFLYFATCYLPPCAGSTLQAPCSKKRTAKTKTSINSCAIWKEIAQNQLGLRWRCSAGFSFCGALGWLRGRDFLFFFLSFRFSFFLSFFLSFRFSFFLSFFLFSFSLYFFISLFPFFLALLVLFPPFLFPVVHPVRTGPPKARGPGLKPI